MAINRRNIKQYDAEKIKSAMGEVRTALNKGREKNATKKRNYKNKEDILILKETLEENVLILDEVYDDSEFKTHLYSKDIKKAKNVVSKLIRSDIECWLENNMSIYIEQSVRKVINISTKKNNSLQ